MTGAELLTITERIAACRDPTDDKFLELAVNGHADLIVSGDGDLLALNPFQQIPVVTPAAFAGRGAVERCCLWSWVLIDTLLFRCLTSFTRRQAKSII
jgi:hypothetical protein